MAEAEQLRKQAEQSREQLTYDLQSQREAFDRELAQQKPRHRSCKKRAETLEGAPYFKQRENRPTVIETAEAGCQGRE
ncbi:MAG: hypothetical protein ACLUVV_04455 [Christensenellales bacterium]